MSTRRPPLVSFEMPEQTTHAGLWLDKYIRDQTRDAVESRHLLVQQVAGIPEPDFYPGFFQRWKDALAGCGAVLREARVQGRMVIGMGNESVLETAVTLHRTYGVPYIPGSALKGLAAAYARQRLDQATWGEGSAAYNIVFGTATNTAPDAAAPDLDDGGAAGYVTFFDALPTPNQRGPLLHADVLTVHHPAYYRGEQDTPPADWDSPTPIPFLSATGTYLVALAGPEAWLERTFEILQRALREMGVGAKTSSGYGRMILREA